MQFNILKKNNYYVDFSENREDYKEIFNFVFPKNLMKNIGENNYAYELDYKNSTLKILENEKEEVLNAPNYSLFCLFYADILMKFSKHDIPIEFSSPNFIGFIQSRIQDLLPEEKEMFDCFVSLNKGKIPSISQNIEEGVNLLTNLILEKGLK